MRVEYSTTVGNFITGTNLNTGVWDAVNAHATTGTMVTIPAVDNPAAYYRQSMTITIESMTTPPVRGETITQAVSGATLVVDSADVDLNTITGYEMNTGTWTDDTVAGGSLLPANQIVISVEYVEAAIYGLDLDTGDWVLDPVHLVTSDDAGGTVMTPAGLLLTRIEHLDYDQFYAEPCGAFIIEYHECLFMAKIERTTLSDAGYQTPGTLDRVFAPNEIMYSFPGYASALQFGTSTVPPQYPFAIPSEPWQRPWGCASPDGYPLNRIAYAEPRGVGAIVGMAIWAEVLYIMKPQGFTAVYGNHPVNFDFQNLGMSQGPAGRFAWVKTDVGIYYVTKNGLFLFRGNAADAMIPLSNRKVEKIFDEDVDWMSATDFITGELIGVSLGWDRSRDEIIISYPKIGEQGGEGQPTTGCPTRVLVYNMVTGEFTEWVYKFPEDNGTEPVGIGIMKNGEDPTDDDYIIFGHPTGNVDGGNDNGRVLFRGNVGHLDQDTLDASGDPELIGNLIPFHVSTPDMTFGRLTPKQSIIRHRSVIYANNGVIKQNTTFNIHDTNDEEDLIYNPGVADNYIQTTVQNNRKVKNKRTSREKDFSTASFEYYNDQETEIPLRLTFPTMTTAPTVGGTITQAISAATLIVTSVDLTNGYVWGTDQHTGTGWDLINGVTGAGILPNWLIPTAMGHINNPLVDNPDEKIEFVAHSAVVAFNDEGDIS
jgi:hypothetical protein